jgi:hypothetical protein
MSRRALPLTVVAVVSLLSGCWLQPGYSPTHQNSNPFETALTPESVGGLHQLWSVPTGFAGQPLVTPGAVFTGGLGSGRVSVRATSRSTGASRWQRDFDDSVSNFPYESILSVAGDEVLTIRTNGLEKLDPGTGATIAAASTPNEIIDAATATAGSGVVAYRALHLSDPNPWVLVVRSQDTLAQLWTATISSTSLGERGPILIADGQLHVEDTTPTGEAIEVFAAAGCGAAICTPTATVPIPPPGTATRTDVGHLFTMTDDGDLVVSRQGFDPRGGLLGSDVAVLAADGTVKWNTTGDLVTRGVAVAGDTVFLAGDDNATPEGEGTLFARSDSSSWRADSTRFLDGTPMIAGGLVYVPTGAGPDGVDVAVFDADGCGAPVCSEIRTIDVGSGNGSIYSMSATAGTLYVNKAGGPEVGRLTAFGL